MLILKRKQNEGFMIGRDIHIVVFETCDGSVKIGIDAPEDIKVLRDELWETKPNETTR